MPSSAEVSIEEDSSSSEEDISPEESLEEQDEKTLEEVMPGFLAANEAVRDYGQAGLFPVNSGRWKVMIYSGACGGSSSPDPFTPSQLPPSQPAPNQLPPIQPAGPSEDLLKNNPGLILLLRGCAAKRPWPWVNEPSGTESSPPKVAPIKHGEPQKKTTRLKSFFEKPKPVSRKSRYPKFENTTEESQEKSRASSKIELSLLKQMQRDLAEYNRNLFDKIALKVGEEAAQNEEPLEFFEFAARVHRILWTAGLGLANEIGVDERWDEWIYVMYLKHRRAVNRLSRERELLRDCRQAGEGASQEEQEDSMQQERESSSERRERSIASRVKERKSYSQKQRERSLERRIASRVEERERSLQQERERSFQQEREMYWERKAEELEIKMQRERESFLRPRFTSSLQRRLGNIVSRMKVLKSSIQQQQEPGSSVHQEPGSSVHQEPGSSVHQERESSVHQERESSVQQQDDESENVEAERQSSSSREKRKSQDEKHRKSRKKR